MKRTRLLMGMPIIVEIVGAMEETPFELVYDYFTKVDNRFSTYKPDSEISRINSGELPEASWSSEMKTVLGLCEQTRQATRGYFDITRDGQRDPSGLVKGWAIDHAAELLWDKGYQNFIIAAGGDVQVSGTNTAGTGWRVGIRSPFNRPEIVKAVQVHNNEGVATSGSYIRGQHVYDPHNPETPLTDIVSLTVIGLDIYEADRFATAAFAMGAAGIAFIEQLAGLEGYMINSEGVATMTSGFESYIAAP